VVTGILPSFESKMSNISDKMTEGKLSDLKANHFGIILGKSLADKLGLERGDKVTVLIPQATVTPAGIQPRLKRFTVVGIFDAGSGFGFDNHLGFINLHDAQKLFLLGDKVSGLRLKIKDVFDAPAFSQKLSHYLGEDYAISNWTGQFGAFFQAVKMEKTMMFLILLLIVAVAAFNLISSLVMVVNDKQSDIAILRTLGALPRTILATFMVQGSVVGVVGTLLGLIGGVLLALNATQIVNWVQHIFHVQFISSSVYFVDYLPSKIEWRDVLHVCLMALFMSFLATIYPAWRASRTQPAEALRYD